MMPVELTARHFLERLNAIGSQEEQKKIIRYFKSEDGRSCNGDVFIGVRMGEVFTIAREFISMPLREIEILLESSYHEARTGAVSIMDFRARDKKITENERKDLFDLYIKRHDRINNWDLVDRAAPYVVGGYLFKQPRDILYQLAVSENMWERRTAIVSTYFFIRQGQLDDTFEIAKILVNDKEDLVQKATGGWLREAGKKDPVRLMAFLDKYGATMPRTSLRYAIEHFDKKTKVHYLGLKHQE